MAGSDPPGGKGWRDVPAKTIAMALVAFATMCTSVTAYLRPNETSARKSFDVLSKALEAEAKSNAQNHDDVVALRGYVEGYVKSREEPHPLKIESAQPPPEQPHARVPAPQTTVTVVALGKPSSPPPLGSAAPPPRFQAPAYKTITQKEDLPIF